ncbi:MAG TPA: ABC transporter permease [Methylomirabilota bacterium]|jgi:peptide/nickel transport system permease protein|nr:ABC transporter permease [Methylomirabilota bacterium]
MAAQDGGEQAGVLMGPATASPAAAEAPATPRPAPRGRLAGLAGGGLAILLIALAVAALADFIAPRGYDDQDLAFALQPPAWAGGTWSNPLGTDPLGRDVLSRIVYGARTSLLLALGSVLIAAVIGVTLGLVSGWAGGRVDAAIMSAVEAQLSLPYLLFAIAFMALLGSSLTNLVIVLVLRSWVVYAQLVRVSVLSMKTREFVTVAVALGARARRIVFRHIAPNVIAPALVVSSFQLAELIIVESSLGFLGLGVQPPTPSWGSMLSQGREYLGSAWWLVTFPGLAIILTVLGANLFGDALRDTLDPRLRTRARAPRGRFRRTLKETS